MNISVLLPAFNAANTIEATIGTVLQQTVSPKEFIILDDGSTDATQEIVRRYGSQIKLISTQNRGAAAARNTLCSEACGDLLAFLDADDLWHPQHLERHIALAEKYPQAVASFTEHVNFTGYGGYSWDHAARAATPTELIAAINFFQRYHQSPGPFSSMSFCTVPKATLRRLRSEPFQANGAEDYYFFTALALLGPVAYSPVETVAYRVHPCSLSSNKLKVVGVAVHAYELMEKDYRIFPDRRFYSSFRKAFASKRRYYAKLLLGAGSVSAARDQLGFSLTNCWTLFSITKSLSLFALSYLPKRLQPNWPGTLRDGMAG